MAAGFAGAMPAPAMLMEEDAAMDHGEYDHREYDHREFDMPNTMRKSAARGAGRPGAALATASRTTTGSFGGDKEEGRPDHTQSSGPLLIRQGNMQLLVESIALAMTSIEGITTSAGGYVSASNTHSEPRQYFREEAGEGETGKTTSQWINTVVSGTLTLRIPGNTFDDVRKRIRETAKDVITEFINVQDVTAQYTDIVTRIKVKETTLNQLEAVSSCCSSVLVLGRGNTIPVQIMKAAQTVQDTIIVQREMRQVTEALESLKVSAASLPRCHWPLLPDHNSLVLALLLCRANKGAWQTASPTALYK